MGVRGGRVAIRGGPVAGQHGARIRPGKGILRRSGGGMRLELRRGVRMVRRRRGTIQWRQGAGQRRLRMGMVRTPRHGGRLRRIGRRGVRRMLLVLVIVRIERTVLVRRRVDRVARLLSRGLRIVRRSPRHDGGRVWRRRGICERREMRMSTGGMVLRREDGVRRT